ncbi:MAG: GNAT family N-acetyltransferase [Thermoanaerobaculia bacterium]
MKGQRLFVRPIDSADSDAIRAFLGLHRPHVDVPDSGLLGKLVGNLVAVLAMHITAADLRIDDIVVASELRRKRIGRVMLDEAEQLAARLDRQRLVIERDNGSAEFLQRVGFEREGPRWIRKVRK